MNLWQLLHLNNASGFIDLFNNIAVVLIAAAFFLSKDNRRLTLIILANYAIAYFIDFAVTHYVHGILRIKIGETSYYLANAAREVIILVFLLDTWMQNKTKAGWCKTYLVVIGISMTCNIILAAIVSTEVTSKLPGVGGFRAIHYHINQLIPFAEVFIAWGSSNNAISRFFSRWRKPKPETPAPL